MSNNNNNNNNNRILNVDADQVLIRAERVIIQNANDDHGSGCRNRTNNAADNVESAQDANANGCRKRRSWI
ncbi:hypothetical protein [Falsibacillus pallidus]|uniref:Uncharacterized protein n=1 Tax=Falsibacillus pallidus TaxID=493781 RepID=A0A370GRN8_9BACI|nr:hypothetical protein [Falsibacillus pallidus]RDI45916.1 hypothetical protein DFR59_102552 [Falsibacillus pallidus]